MLKIYTVKSEEQIKIGNITIAKRVVVDQLGQERLIHVDLKAEVSVILAITPDQKIVCLSQFRFGPGKIMIELPGGKIDPGEDFLEAGKRELLEETGYSGQFEYVGSTYAGPNSTSKRHVLVCKEAVKIQEPQPTIYESLETTLVDLREFRNMIKSGQVFPTESCYLALDYMRLL